MRVGSRHVTLVPQLSFLTNIAGATAIVWKGHAERTLFLKTDTWRATSTGTQTKRIRKADRNEELTYDFLSLC